MLAGICTDLWDQDSLKNKRISEVVFEPSGDTMEAEYKRWKEALKRSMNWAN